MCTSLMLTIPKLTCKEGHGQFMNIVSILSVYTRKVAMSHTMASGHCSVV